jgi:hypothetical protein
MALGRVRDGRMELRRMAVKVVVRWSVVVRRHAWNPVHEVMQSVAGRTLVGIHVFSSLLVQHRASPSDDRRLHAAHSL